MLGSAGPDGLLDEPHGTAGAQARGPAGALGHRGPGCLHGDQPGHVTGGVTAGLAGEGRVDDQPHSGNGERGLGQVGGDDDAATARGGLTADRAVLLARGKAAVEREDLGAGDETAEQLDDLVDLPGSGDEDEGVVVGLVVPCGHPRDVLEEVPGDTPRVGPRARARLPEDLERVQRALAVDEWGRTVVVAEQCGDARGVEGGRHRDERQLPQLAHLGEHPEQQVGVEGSLVDLVEDDGGRAGELGVGEQPTDEHPRGHELHPRARPDAALAADGVADEVTDLRAGQVGQPSRRRTHRDPPGAGDDDPSFDAVGDERGRQCRLAGPRRGLDDRDAPGRDRRPQVVERLGEGESLPDRAQVEVGHGVEPRTSSAGVSARGRRVASSCRSSGP